MYLAVTLYFPSEQFSLNSILSTIYITRIFCNALAKSVLLLNTHTYLHIPIRAHTHTHIVQQYTHVYTDLGRVCRQGSAVSSVQ